MAQAAPTSGAPGTPRTTGNTATTTRPATSDIFGAQAHTAARWGVPVAAGLVYGFWAAAINRSGGPITGWNVLFGFTCAIVFAGLYIGVRMLAPFLKREWHALLWAAFTGIAFGFLYSQTGATVLRSTMMSLGVAAGVFAVAFYRYYTHEDAEGHQVS